MRYLHIPQMGDLSLSGRTLTNIALPLLRGLLALIPSGLARPL